MNSILYFFIYSFLGWVCECIFCSIPAKKAINRGFLLGPYCPIYGFGALLVIHFLRPFTDHPIVLYVTGVIVTSILEYFTSWLMETLFHTKWWDYSTYPFNIHGRVCLRNSLLFGIMVLFVYYVVHPSITHFVLSFPYTIRILLTILLLACILYDLYHTTMALLRKNKDFVEIESSIKELRREFKEAKIFPLDEPLSQSIQRVLDNTDADEILLSHITHIHEMMNDASMKRKATHDRLRKAFPNKKETDTRERILELFQAIHDSFHQN